MPSRATNRRQRLIVAAVHTLDGDGPQPAGRDELARRDVVPAVDEKEPSPSRDQQQARRARKPAEIRDVQRRRHDQRLELAERRDRPAGHGAVRVCD